MITRKSNDRVRMWVSPLFKRQLKAKASAEGFKLIDYTQELAKNMKNDLLPKKEDFKKFDFRI